MSVTTARACLLSILVTATALGISSASSHGPPELQDWFMGLASKNKVACCDGGDATRIEDADWESKAGHYRVRLPRSPQGYGVGEAGVWVDVPDEAVVEVPNKDGRTLVWPYYVNGMPVVRCFLPGSMT
jgi:hypothetical protein